MAKKRKKQDVAEKIGKAFDQASNAAMKACDQKWKNDPDRAERCRFQVDEWLSRMEQRVRRRVGLPIDPTLPER